MRLPYVPKDVDVVEGDDQATNIIERVKQRRGSAGLLDLDRALLHAPAIADGWNSFFGSIRSRSTLPTSIRELAICRVAVLNEAWYEWSQHAPLLLSAPEMSQQHVDIVRISPPHRILDDVLDEQHSALMAYTDAMTLDIRVPDSVFSRLTNNFGVKEIIEITATIAGYNCVSRFLVALDVGEMNQEGEPDI